jgi:hypothetical protein
MGNTLKSKACVWGFEGRGPCGVLELGISHYTATSEVGRRGRIPQPVVAVAVAGLERRVVCWD